MISKEKNWPYLALGIASFLAFGMEFILALVEMKVYNPTRDGAFSFSFSQILCHWILTYIIWGSLAFLLHVVAKKKLNFDMFSFKGKINASSLFIILVMCTLHIIYATYSWDWQLKPLAEYNGFVNFFGNSGRIAFIFQVVYYFFEGLVMMVLIAFGQEYGERQFGKKNIPWGGILLALTWGLFHYITKFSLETAISCSLIAVYFGICYLLLKKNAFYSWILFFVVYTL